MRILGIDPGLTTTGLGLVDGDRQHPRVVEWLVIRTNASHANPARLKELAEDFASYVEEVRPELAVIEKLFFKTNTRSAMQVAEARGVLLTVVESRGIPIMEVSPLELKMSITGDGKADKVQMQSMVKNILKLKEIPTPADAADGLALALHGHFSYASTLPAVMRR